jgi:hypothetical protein
LLQGGGCTPCFDVRVNGDKIFDFKIANAKRLRRYKKGEPYVDFDLTRYDVRVQGNVKMQFYNEGMTANSKIFHFWFHTGFISRNYMILGKNVIDKITKEKRGVYASNFAVEMYLHRVQTDPEDEDVDRMAASLGASFIAEEGPKVAVAAPSRPSIFGALGSPTSSRSVSGLRRRKSMSADRSDDSPSASAPKCMYPTTLTIYMYACKAYQCVLFAAPLVSPQRRRKSVAALAADRLLAKEDNFVLNSTS